MLHLSFIFLLSHVLTNSLPVHVLMGTLMLHWDEPEDDMNKVMTTALLAGGLMLMNSPEAAAHKEVRHTYQPPAYQYYYAGVDQRRARHMPRWLQRNESFRKWYRHTSLHNNRRLAWHQLFDMYRWERRHGYRYDKHYGDNDHYRDRNRRSGRRHRH